jgi:hypothetical protein
MSVELTPPPHAIERWLVRADAMPWGAFFRIAIGYEFVNVHLSSSAQHALGWNLVAWFIVLLVALRVIPAILRKLLPFSPEANAIWAQRRMLAKRFDSFQWQKLLWFGVGMLACMLASRRVERPVALLALFCVVGGGLGMALWRRNANDHAAGRQPKAVAH